MKPLSLILIAILFFALLVRGGEKEETYLRKTMIPQARELLLRIAQTNDLPSTTNDVQSYQVDYYDDGWIANMQLTNGWVFRFFADQKETNVSAIHLPGKKEETFLKETLIPVARGFLLRIGQTNDLPFTTNQVRSYKVDYLNYNPGCGADIVLTNRWIFEFVSGSTVLSGGKTTQQWGQTEVRRFQRPIKTYYNLVDVPKEKIEAVKALNLQNKLSKTNALALAKKYFKLLGHKEENFHPPEISQSYWSGGEDGRGGSLPYYEVSWYRNDVNLADVNNGSVDFPQVLITVSGVDSSLIYYSRFYLPIGSDF